MSGDGDLATQLKELRFEDLLKLGFAGILVYGGYRLVKKVTAPREEDE